MQNHIAYMFLFIVVFRLYNLILIDLDFEN